MSESVFLYDLVLVFWFVYFATDCMRDSRITNNDLDLNIIVLLVF